MKIRISREMRNRILETFFLIVDVLSGSLLLGYFINPPSASNLFIVPCVIFAASLVMTVRVWFDPDRVRASQSDAMLDLAGRTLSAMSEGLNANSAQKVCDLLLPATDTIAVAITDADHILGYSGANKELNPTWAPIRTQATHNVIESGEMQVLYTAEEIGFPERRNVINAAIIVPLIVSDNVVGTLKFYYPHARKVTATQQSIASGFADLLSSQIAAWKFKDQKKLATSMELKALQSQINPHFLFNTINTISSYIRTDPAKARVLLREFATFYRRTLEDASDLIPLYREVDQTSRYLQFEIARFGEDRLQLSCDIPDDLAGLLVPAFMIQPLVENYVKHAMPATGTLHIAIKASRVNDDDLSIDVSDDGVGMSEESRSTIKKKKESTGLGIAVRNINDRMKGYYGPESHMHVESEEGVGTTITLLLKHGCTPREHEDGE